MQVRHLCFATDPQLEHGKSESEIVPPAPSGVVACPCCGAAYRYAGSAIARGIPQRSPMCYRKQQRPANEGALLVAASVVAAIQLRGEAIKPSPKLTARLVLAEVERRR